MKISARSALMAGVATVTASAVLVAPSVQPLRPPKPAIQLAAAVQPLAQPQFDPAAFLIGIPPSLGTAFPTPQPPPPAPTPGAIGSSIKDIYNSVEFWVDYGFEVGAWAFGWVPWIGWLAPQIWPIGYTLGESIVRSIVFNTADWLDGNVGFGEGLVNVGQDTIQAFINFGIAEWNFWLPNLPIPPLPGIFTAQQTTTLMGPTTTPLAGFANPAGGLLEGVTAPVRNGIGFGAGLVRDTIDGIPPGSDLAGQSVPAAVQQAAEDVGETARGARIETRANQAPELAKGPETVAKRLVRAQGEVRGAVANAADDVTNAVRIGKPSKGSEDVAKAPTTKSKGFSDTASKVVKDVRQAATNAHQAAKDRNADDK
jgi:hypothetical protein